MSHPIALPAECIERGAGFRRGDALVGALGGVGTAFVLMGSLFLLLSQRNKTRMA